MDDALHTEKNLLQMLHGKPESVWKAQLTEKCLLILTGDCF